MSSIQLTEVTIGIPVFNEEERIINAVRSAAPQCVRLIIADNASEDNTEVICRNLMTEYANIEYFRHEKNLGALENWFFLLSLTKTKYFMTLGSHDYIGQNSVKNLVKLLEEDPEVVLAAGRLLYEYEDSGVSMPSEDYEFNTWKGGLNSSVKERIRALLFTDARLPWLAYGLFRTSVYKECFSRSLPTIGIDQVFLARVARRGKIAISTVASYYAWVHKRHGERQSYVERLLARDMHVDLVKKSRDLMRRELFAILKDVENPKTFIEELILKIRMMVRYGPFKESSGDFWGYFLYLPVKIAGEVRRTRRRFSKSVKNSQDSPK
jgi:glycosyltransferase involved in cell wall biosynthesis